jgi:hypothetical protein
MALLIWSQPSVLLRPSIASLSLTIPTEALFTSRVFEGIGGDYFVSRNFSDRLFTSLGFEGIIPGYPHKSPPF